MNVETNPQELLQSLIDRAEIEAQRCAEAESSVVEGRTQLRELIARGPLNRETLRSIARVTRLARQHARWRRTVARVLQERVNALAESLHGIRLYPRPGSDEALAA